MAVGPDVHQAHGEDTERYVLTNLNMVRPRRAAGAAGSADRGRARGPGGNGSPWRPPLAHPWELVDTASHTRACAQCPWAGLSGGSNLV